MIYKNRAELLRAAADTIEMQEHFGIEPTGKCDGILVKLAEYKFDDLTAWEFPVCVVEGKPLFAGDEYYYSDSRFVADKKSTPYTDATWKDCTLTPPKPKTVTAELSFKCVEQLARGNYCSLYHEEVMTACRKALEELK